MILRGSRPSGAGVVYQNIDASEFGDRTVGQVWYLLVPRIVSSDERDFDPTSL